MVKKIMAVGVACLNVFLLAGICSAGPDAATDELIYDQPLPGKIAITAFVRNQNTLIFAEYEHKVMSYTPWLRLVDIDTHLERKIEQVVKDARVLFLFPGTAEYVAGIVAKYKDLNHHQAGRAAVWKLDRYAVFKYNFKECLYKEIYLSEDRLFPCGFDGKNMLLCIKGMESEIQRNPRNNEPIAVYYRGTPRYLSVNLNTGKTLVTDFTDILGRVYWASHDYTKGMSIVQRSKGQNNVEQIIVNDLPEKLLDYGYDFELLPQSYIMISYSLDKTSKYYIFDPRGSEQLRCQEVIAPEYLFRQFHYDSNAKQLCYYYLKRGYAHQGAAYHMRIYKRKLPSNLYHE